MGTSFKTEILLIYSFFFFHLDPYSSPLPSMPTYPFVMVDHFLKQVLLFLLFVSCLYNHLTDQGPGTMHNLLEVIISPATSALGRFSSSLLTVFFTLSKKVSLTSSTMELACDSVAILTAESLRNQAKSPTESVLCVPLQPSHRKSGWSVHYSFIGI